MFSELYRQSCFLFYHNSTTKWSSMVGLVCWCKHRAVQLKVYHIIYNFPSNIVVFIIFNVVLLFPLYFSKINHLKPLLNPFQESYKQKYYYWIGLSIIFRNFFLVMQAVPTRMKLIISTALMITFSLLFGSLCPYKNKLVNIQELLLLLNLTIVYAVSYQNNGNLFSTITNVMISLALIQLCVTVLYHILTYTCRSCSIVRIIQTTMQIQANATIKLWRLQALYAIVVNDMLFWYCIHN